MLEELGTAAQFSNLIVLRAGNVWLLAGFEEFLAEQFVECADVGAEVLRDLRERDFWVAAQRDLRNVVAVLVGVTRRHKEHSSKPAETSRIECPLNTHQALHLNSLGDICKRVS